MERTDKDRLASWLVGRREISENKREVMGAAGGGNEKMSPTSPCGFSLSLCVFLDYDKLANDVQY